MTFREMKKCLGPFSFFTPFFLIMHVILSVNVDMGLHYTYAIWNHIFADPFIPIMRISVGGHKKKKNMSRSRNPVMFGTTTTLPMIWYIFIKLFSNSQAWLFTYPYLTFKYV